MWFAIALTLSFIPAVLSFSGGPPREVCTSMTPGHYGTSPQTTTSKFSVNVNKVNYLPGEEISVTLSSCGGAMFKGFILQARRADFDTNTSVAIGRFNTPLGTKGLTCGSDFAAVTHDTGDLKSSMTFTWTAPASSVGHIVFKATFVEDLNTYWVKVNSQPVRDVSVPTAVKFDQSMYPSPSTCGATTLIMPTTTSTYPWMIIDKMGPSVARDPDCGQTKGCIYDCHDTYCRVGITWETSLSTNAVLFEMSLTTSETDNIWMAMGLSQDTMMGDDRVVECVLNGGSVAVYSSENSRYKTNERLDNVDQLRGIGGGVSNGVFKCSFALSLENDDYPFYSLEEAHHILFATGKTLFGSDYKKIHTEHMMTAWTIHLMSPERHIFWSSIGSSSGKASNVYPLMVAALMGLLFWRNYIR